MKQLTALLVSVLLSLSPVAAQADSAYTLVRGQQWSGVKIGNSAPRSLDSVCEGSSCFRIHGYYTLNTRLLKQYGIRDISFSELAKVSEVLEADEKLRLPYDLGKEIYRKAYHEYIINKFSDNN